MGSIRISRNLGLMLTGLWLLLYGIFGLFNVSVSPAVMHILALVAGVLVFLEYKD